MLAINKKVCMCTDEIVYMLGNFPSFGCVCFPMSFLL